MGQAASAGATLFQAGSSIASGFGTARSDTYQAGALDLAAQEGGLKSLQTNAQRTFEISQTLGNIDAVTAAAHVDPSSPSAMAVRNQQETQMTMRKGIEVSSLDAQAEEDAASASYMKQAGTMALIGGGVGAAGDLLKGASGLPLFGSDALPMTSNGFVAGPV